MLLLVLLSACTPTPCDTSSVASGTMEAKIGGKAWFTPTATFNWAEEALQVSTTPTQVATDATGEKSIILVLERTREGETVRAAVEAGRFPLEIDLPIGADDAVAWLFRADKASHDSRTLGGTVTLSAAGISGGEEDFVQGCFRFEVQDDTVGVIAVEDGRFNSIVPEDDTATSY